MKLVAGLGNPGKEYEHTRHNMGFDVIDELARRWSVNVWKTDMKAEIASVVRFGEKILLVKPLTYMNLSGDAVGAIANYYKILQKIFISSAMIWICRRGKHGFERRGLPAVIMASNP